MNETVKRDQARRSMIEVARGMLNGSVQLIDGCRKLVALRAKELYPLRPHLMYSGVSSRKPMIIRLDNAGRCTAPIFWNASTERMPEISIRFGQHCWMPVGRSLTKSNYYDCDPIIGGPTRVAVRICI